MLISFISARVNHPRVMIHGYRTMIRIEYKGYDPKEADDEICKVADEIIDQNDHYGHYPIDIHDGSSGHREGIITFYEKNRM